MDMKSALARRALFICPGVILALQLLVIPPVSEAASYHPEKWLITGSISYDVTQATGLNEHAASLMPGSGPLQGLIGGRLLVERGLYEPEWTHWVDIGYLGATVASNSEETGRPYTHTLKTFAVVPLGATYWFNRTAYMDFGVGLGLGLGFGSGYDFKYQDGSGDEKTVSYSGGVAPIVDAKLQSRLWFGDTFALNVAGALRYYSPSMKDAAGTTELSSGLTSLSATVGLTWAIGGVRGTGRSYVEVIKGKPSKEFRQQPRPSQSPRKQTSKK